MPEERVRRLRRRIFKAVGEQDLTKARNLQRLMLRSWSNTLISVWQVTQRNAGRATARDRWAGRVDRPGPGQGGGAGAGASGSRFPGAFQPPAFASRVILRPLGSCTFLTSGLPADSACRTPSGLSRSAWSRYSRGGCRLNPGDGGVLPTGRWTPVGTCRLTGRHRRFTRVHPSALPQPVIPGRNGDPWAFPRAPHPAVTRSARQGGNSPCTLDRELRHRHEPALLPRAPLAPSDFVSHPAFVVEPD